MSISYSPSSKRTSGWGIVSLVCAVAVACGFAIILFLFLHWKLALPKSLNNAPPSLINLCIATLMTNLVGCFGVCFGLGGIFQTDRSRTLAVWGIIVNFIVLLSGILAILLTVH